MRQTIHNNLIKIVEILSDQQYHDGTSLGRQLKITRAAVWKVIKKLEQYGIALRSIKGKGYCLEHPLILLNDKKIISQLKNSAIQIDLLEKIDSTNEYLKESIAQNKKIKVCLAETQRRGRGRFARHWHSPFGQNIYLSLLYPLQKDISELAGLSLVVGLAICRTIENLLQLKEKIMVKWPNDIVINHHKIAGTLIEIQAESHGYCQAIIGIGVNVNMREANKKQISQQWTSLQKITAQYHDRNQLCTALINNLLEYLERFSSQGFKAFQEEWQQRDYLYDQPVKLISGTVKQQGIAAGINSQGHLLLKVSDKNTQAFSSGDTSLFSER